jgi:hypothetical protein
MHVGSTVNDLIVWNPAVLLQFDVIPYNCNVFR